MLIQAGMHYQQYMSTTTDKGRSTVEARAANQSMNQQKMKVPVPIHSGK